MDKEELERRFVEERLDLIAEGMKEAIKEEVDRLEKEGLPIYVEIDGKVVNINSPENKDKL